MAKWEIFSFLLSKGKTCVRNAPSEETSRKRKNKSAAIQECCGAALGGRTLLDWPLHKVIWIRNASSISPNVSFGEEPISRFAVGYTQKQKSFSFPLPKKSFGQTNVRGISDVKDAVRVHNATACFSFRRDRAKAQKRREKPSLGIGVSQALLHIFHK